MQNLVTPLDAREMRWNRKCELAKTIGESVISITLNVPNQMKNQDKFIRIHKSACNEFILLLEKNNIKIIHTESDITSDGAYMLLAVDCDSLRAKKIAIDFEEGMAVYRLLDIDVMNKETKVIGRLELDLPPRKCYLCDNDAKLCIVGKKHSLDEIMGKINELTETKEQKLKRIADYALKGILYEVSAYPKPGLVTSNDSGSHSDMDIFTFIDSAMAIAPYFYKLAELGAESLSHTNNETMKLVRECGMSAEKAMFTATNSVNTHKGMIFAMGIVCVCGGICTANDEKITAERLSKYSQDLLAGVAEKELVPLNALSEHELSMRKLTNGEKLYLKYGVLGARGEAERGFPTCINVGLPMLKKSVECGLKMNDALVNTLFALMSVAEDTNILNRGGQEALNFVRLRAKEILDVGGISTEKGKLAIELFDIWLKKNGLSSGGVADMLAVTTAIYFMETLQK